MSVSVPVSVPVTMVSYAVPGPRRPCGLPVPVAPGVGPVPSEPVAPVPSGLRTSPPELPVPGAPEPPPLAALATRTSPPEPVILLVAPEPRILRPSELPVPRASGLPPVTALSRPVPLIPLERRIPRPLTVPGITAPGVRASPLGVPATGAPEPPALAARIPPPEPAVPVASPPRIPPGLPGPVPPAVRMSRPPESPVSPALDPRLRALGRPSPVAPVLGRPAPGVLRRRVRGTLGAPARGSIVPRLRVLDRAESGHPYEYGYDPGPHDAHLGTPPPSARSGGCLLLNNSLPGLPGRLTIGEGRRMCRDLRIRRAPYPARGTTHRARLTGRAVRSDGTAQCGQTRRVFDRVA